MGRKLTTLNRDHPHNALKNSEQKTYEAYRQLSNEALNFICIQQGIETTLPRHKKIAKIQSRISEEWLKKWEDRFGWPFKDIYDKELYGKHLAEIAKKEMESHRTKAQVEREGSK